LIIEIDEQMRSDLELIKLHYSNGEGYPSFKETLQVLIGEVLEKLGNDSQGVSRNFKLMSKSV
jgi:hypothetical protein